LSSSLRKVYLILSLAVLAGFVPASAQSNKESSPLAAIAAYEGVNREQRLAGGAKKEGELNLYTSLTVEDMAAITGAFEKKYGVKVKTWRASSEKVVQRIITEAQAGRFDFDIVENNGPQLESLHREKLLQPVKSPYFNDLIPQAVLPHKEWVGTRLNVFVHAYNTRQVKKEELPKTYQDLLDPRWKGRLGIEAEDLDWFAALVKELGEDKGIKLFKDIVATNGLSVRKGHTLLTNMVASGEVPLALTVFNFTAEQMKQKGAPLDWFVMWPAIARANGLAVSRKAPHPHMAVLFYDFMISDGQEILAKRDFTITSQKIQTPFNKIPLKLIDPAIVLDENQKWSNLYSEIITKQSK
jgi:iron(III) transport system substrate-binding protein